MKQAKVAIAAISLIAMFVVAAGQDDRKPCALRGGIYLDIGSTCDGIYVEGLCTGPDNAPEKQCCIPHPGFSERERGFLGDKRCTNRWGTCQNSSLTCHGVYKSNFCTGPSSIQCCVPRPTDIEDVRCMNRRGICQVTNVPCTGSYAPGFCGGASNRQCCIPCSDLEFEFGDISNLRPTGASLETAQETAALSYDGVRASARMAMLDFGRMEIVMDNIKEVADTHEFDAAIIAGLISRVSGVGRNLDRGYAENGYSYGVMALDADEVSVVGGPYSTRHIKQGTEILIGLIKQAQVAKPEWTLAQQLQTGVATYYRQTTYRFDRNFSEVDYGTPNNDFSNDIIARARYYRTQEFK